MRSKTALATVLAGLIGFASVPAQAETLDRLYDEVPPVLAAMKSAGVTFTYLGERGGLKGFIAQQGEGKAQVYYVTPDGNHVVAGYMFSRDGTNVTGVQLGKSGVNLKVLSNENKIAKTPKTPEQASREAVRSDQTGNTTRDGTGSGDVNAKFRAAIERAATFAIGPDNAPIAVLVADPTDQESFAYWDKLRPFAENGRIKVVILPVGETRQGTRTARALLSNEQPRAAWKQADGPIDMDQPEQGTAAWRRGQEQVRANARFVASAGINAAPQVLFVHNGAIQRYTEGVDGLSDVVSSLTDTSKEG